MSGANGVPPSQHVDEGGEIVLNRFYDFLAKFTSSAEGTTDGTDGVQLYRDYLAQIGAMVQNDKNTVYVDVQHVFAVRRRGCSCMWLHVVGCALVLRVVLVHVVDVCVQGGRMSWTGGSFALVLWQKCYYHTAVIRMIQVVY